MTSLWVLDVARRRRAVRGRPPGPARRRRPTTCRPRSGSGASGPARARPGSPPTPPTRATGSPSLRWPGSSSWPTSGRHGDHRRRARARRRPAARPHRHAGWRGSTGAGPLGGRARRPLLGPGAGRGRRPRGALGGGGVRRGRGDGPLPRLLVGTRRHRRSWSPGSTTPPCSAGGSPTRPTPTRPPPRSPTRPPARANADVSAWILRLDGTRVEVVWDRTAWPYLAEAAWDDHGPLHRPAPARSAAPSRCVASTPLDGTTASCGATVTTRGWSAAPARPPGWRTVGWWCAPTGTAPGSCWWTARRSPPTTCTSARWSTSGTTEVVFTANPLDDATVPRRVALDVVGARPAHRRRRRAHGRGRRETSSSCGGPPSTWCGPRTDGPRWSDPGQPGGRTARRAERHHPPRRRASAGHRPAAPARRVPDGARSPCCSTPTADRTRSACCERTAPT